MGDPTSLDVTAAATALRRGDFSAVELTRAYLERIDRYDGALNAYIRVIAESALRQAKAADKRRESGRPLSAMDGIPVALKDNIDLNGYETTNGLARGSVARQDAFVVRSLKAAGAVILGKLNMHEGALGSTTDNPHHGATHNPWRKGHTPGGSSGGSGAAVAARLCAMALGTDTMGSVRLPAHYCGVVGMKPTTGLISTRGVTPLTYQYDHVGPLTRSSRDLALLLSLLVAHDLENPESVAWPEGSWSFGPMLPDLMYWRVGVVDCFERMPVEPGVKAGFERGLEALRQADAEIVPIDWQDFDATRTRLAGFLISEAEAGHALAKRRKRDPQSFSPEFSAMLDYGSRAEGQRLVEARQLVTQVGHGFRRLFEQVDLVVAPTAPQTAFPHGGEVRRNQADFTLIGNFSRCPALSLPVGLDDSGLPVGFQIYAAPFQELRLVAAAAAMEALLGQPAMPAMKGMAKRRSVGA